jgi:hypothetical protein
MAVEKIDIRVRQKPVDCCFECPVCEEEIEIDYSEFCDMAGEPCDWEYTEIECPKCNAKLEIDSQEWD